MNKSNTDNTEPTLEQLKHCVQLLAHSLAQHRETCEHITLLNALPLVTKKMSLVNNNSRHNNGNKIYKEALMLSKSSLAPIEATIKEQRTQPRINVSSFVKIIVPATGEEWEGNLSNISWGGLRIRTKSLLGKPNYLLNIALPYPKESDIHVQAMIVRSWESEGMYSTAIRFTNISQKNEYKLNKLLELLLNEADDKKRKDTRFAQRIDVSYGDNEELKTTLEDISSGGMKITMPEPMELNKSIKVQLDGLDDAYNLSLRARVIRQQVITISDFEMYQMAIEFEHPTTELCSMVQGLIQGMMDKGKVVQDIVDKTAIPTFD